MRKHYTHQTTLKLRLGSTCPPDVKERLLKIRDEARADAEAQRRRAAALERAEKYETWQEIKLTSYKLR